MVDSISALNIKSRDVVSEKNYKIGEKRYKLIGDVVGMDVTQARKILSDFNLEFSGSGSIINYQSPSAGSKILEGETVRLYLTN